MATIANLHRSISEMTGEKFYELIRHIRSLRREMPLKPVKKTAKKTIKKKQMTIEKHLSSVRDTSKAELLKRLLEIQKRRKHR